MPSTAKETPIVSANCDAVEVTLPNKLPKDSPVKGRKREQPQLAKEHKEPMKEQTPVSKDTNTNEKLSSLPKEPETKKESLAVTNTTNIQQVIKNFTKQITIIITKKEGNSYIIPKKFTILLKFGNLN